MKDEGFNMSRSVCNTTTPVASKTHREVRSTMFCRGPVFALVAVLLALFMLVVFRPSYTFTNSILITFGLVASAAYLTLSIWVKYHNLDNFGCSEEGIKRVVETKANINGDLPTRMRCAVELVKEYYDLVTDWYEWGWGPSFQLGSAQRSEDESWLEGLRRHDYWMAYKSGINAGEKWLDIGCGVGGPLKNVVRFTGANVTGVNYSKFQVDKANSYIAQAGFSQLGHVIHMDYHTLSEHLPANSFDGAYALEAICHSIDKTKVYTEVFKILKPGSTFAMMEWCLKKKYDSNNVQHKRCKDAIELIAAIPLLESEDDILAALSSVGFIIEEKIDMCYQPGFSIPWWKCLTSGVSNILVGKVGLRITQYCLRCIEFIKLLAPGTAAAHKKIISEIPYVVKSGELDIFNPHFYIRCRKPAE